MVRGCDLCTSVLAFHWFSAGLFGGVLCVSSNPFLSIPGIQISTILEPSIIFVILITFC